MTDQDRIDKLIQTLMMIKRSLDIVKEATNEEGTKYNITRVQQTIEFVIQKNADQINFNPAL